MLARLSALVVWALVAATAVFWALRLGARPVGVPANAVVVGDSAARGDLTRLLGAAPVAPPPLAVVPEAASRFRLLGVMAPKRSAPAGAGRSGVALIAVDGKPARAFAVGARVEEGLVLQSVSLRGAAIGPPQGASAVTLEMPPLLPPATGTLPALGAATGIPSAGFAPPPGALPPAGIRAQRSQQQPAIGFPGQPPIGFPSQPSNPDLGRPENGNAGVAPTD